MRLLAAGRRRIKWERHWAHRLALGIFGRAEKELYGLARSLQGCQMLSLGLLKRPVSEDTLVGRPEVVVLWRRLLLAFMLCPFYCQGRHSVVYVSKTGIRLDSR